MTAIRGITISVNYAPQLSMTLPRNLRHLTECVVVTSPEDEETKAVARSVPGVRLFETDAFTRHNAFFNKGLAFEEAWDHFGRDGQWLVWDADILLPDEVNWGPMQPDTLYGCRRRMVADPSQWAPDSDWRRFPVMADGGPIGFFQLFHADAPNLKGRRPWYDVSFSHAGGGDAYFMNLFPPSKRKVLPLEVLHIGERDRNWFGANEEGRRIMDAFMVWNGWSRARTCRRIDPRIVEQVGEIKERVDVPGYGISDFELPFVKRARARRQMGA
jgi:hypothetical protein